MIGWLTLVVFGVVFGGSLVIGWLLLREIDRWREEP